MLHPSPDRAAHGRTAHAYPRPSVRPALLAAATRLSLDEALEHGVPSTGRLVLTLPGGLWIERLHEEGACLRDGDVDGENRNLIGTMASPDGTLTFCQEHPLPSHINLVHPTVIDEEDIDQQQLVLQLIHGDTPAWIEVYATQRRRSKGCPALVRVSRDRPDIRQTPVRTAEPWERLNISELRALARELAK